MILVTYSIRLLEVAFFVGMAGASVVVVLSFVDFAKELFGKAKPTQPQA